MKVSVIGLGYVGSVAAAGFASSGHEVLGIDVDAAKIEAYCAGQVPFYEPQLSDLISDAVKCGNLSFTHADDVDESFGDVIVIATGTPTGALGGADLTQVTSALAWVSSKQNGDGSVVMMKSTVPPGTGVRLCESILNGSGLQYVSNPEFLREGQAVYDWFHPDRIVIGGHDAKAIDTVKALYEQYEAPCVVTDITSAEMTKYASNAFLATKISFINEIAVLCDRLGATIDDVTRGISLDPRIGASFLRAGVGYGGSCFPKDVRALDQLAVTYDYNFELLRSVINVNNRQRFLPLYALREKFGKLNGVRIAILGLAFKPETDDVRESPALDLIRVLVADGADVVAYDPKASDNAKGLLPSSVQLAKDPVECASDAQAIVLMTEWPDIVNANWKQIADYAAAPKFLFDGRNALDCMGLESLGFEYKGVGRGVR